MSSQALAPRRAARAVPPDADRWLDLSEEPLPTDLVGWATLASCGASVTFTGTVRDHAEGRPGVEQLAYEAYRELALHRLTEIEAEARRRWPEIGRVALLHRVGVLAVGDVAVVVTVSAPHRGEAFEAARWCIDTVKATVPIWKRERWAGGDDWGTDAHPIRDVAAGAGPHGGDRPGSGS